MPIPLAAAEGAAEILTELFVVLLAAKLGQELARRSALVATSVGITSAVLIDLGIVDTPAARGSSMTSSPCCCSRWRRGARAMAASTRSRPRSSPG